MVYPSGDTRSVSIALHAQVNVIMRLLLLMPRIKMLLRCERTQEVPQRHSKHWLSWLLSSMTAGSQPRSCLQYNTQQNIPGTFYTRSEEEMSAEHRQRVCDYFKASKGNFLLILRISCKGMWYWHLLRGAKNKSLSICYCIFCHMA